MYTQYREKGLEILAFPCNQFAGQEPACETDLKEFIKKNNVEFPFFAKINVNGANTIPLYSFLKNKQGGLLGNFIKWNFTKFLCNKDGEPVKRYGPSTEPKVSFSFTREEVIFIVSPWFCFRISTRIWKSYSEGHSSSQSLLFRFRSFVELSRYSCWFVYPFILISYDAIILSFFSSIHPERIYPSRVIVRTNVQLLMAEFQQYFWILEWKFWCPLVSFSENVCMNYTLTFFPRLVNESTSSYSPPYLNSCYS